MLIYGDTLESQGFSFFTEVKISTTRPLRQCGPRFGRIRRATVFHFPLFGGGNSEADDLGGEGAAVAES